ncbi:MAG: S8 family serine peptidase [Erysipelotrichaceae bacterium]|jgi:hypothetical protein|nr:S8 family serine peptidase [Erysipelotrichaceae bacterium]
MIVKKRQVAILGILMLGLVSLFVTLVPKSETTYEVPKMQFRAAAIEDDFAGDGVLAVLSKEASFAFKEYQATDFADYGCYEVVDLTAQTGALVQKQLTAEAINDEVTITALKAEDLYLENINDFRRILSLKINQSSDQDQIKIRHSIKDGNVHKKMVIKTIDQLLEREDIDYASPNYVYEKDDSYGNDPLVTNGSRFDLMQIRAHAAWDITRGFRNTKVGVMDTGIDAYHEDLMNRVNHSLSRDCRYGRIVNPIIPYDVRYHGSHVAGIIGAQGNNGYGVSGINWNVSLVALIIDELGLWFSDNAILAIDHATANGIRVLNYSGGTTNRSTGSQNSYDAAFRAALVNYPGLFVTSAGNNNSNNDAVGYYPASYATQLSNVIAVGSVDRYDVRASTSNYGLSSVGIYAPGVNILSTVPGISYYETYSGTSMAAAQVSGVAALVLSLRPNLSGAQLRSHIMAHADTIQINVPSGRQSVKRLNAFNPVSYYAPVFLNNGYNQNYETTITGVSGGNVLHGEVIIPSLIRIGAVSAIVAGIGASAFANQTQLYDIIIQNNVRSIGNSAFANSGLQNIYNYSYTPQPINSLTFSGVNLNNVTLWVRQNMEQIYRNAGWGIFEIRAELI